MELPQSNWSSQVDSYSGWDETERKIEERWEASCDNGHDCDMLTKRMEWPEQQARATCDTPTQARCKQTTPTGRTQTSTRNKSIISKAMQYRQDIITRMLLYESGVNYNVNSNYTNYLAQLCCRFFFAFWKIPSANLRILWRHLQMKLRNV